MDKINELEEKVNELKEKFSLDSMLELSDDELEKLGSLIEQLKELLK